MEVKVFEALSDIPDAMARACSYPAVQKFFLSMDWFCCLYETSVCTTMQPRIYGLLDDDDRPVGMLFCAIEPGKRTLFSLTNFYTMEFGFTAPADKGPAGEAIAQLIGHIQSERPKWHTIDFRFFQESETDSTAMRRALEENGFSVSRFFMYENWYARLPDGDFESYYAGLSSRVKNTIARKEKNLRKSHRVDIRIHAAPGDGLEKAIDDYVSIYNKSWKRPEPFPEFIPRLVSMTSELGILRLGILYIDGRPAAAQLWINTSVKALIYKLAYDDEFSAFSPGSILSREMFRHAIDTDRITEIDYGVGSENYKKDWMSATREIGGLQAYNRKTMAGLYRSIVKSTVSAAKRVRRG